MFRKRPVNIHVTCTPQEGTILRKAEKAFRRKNGGGANTDMSRFLRELGIAYYKSL